MNNFSWDLPYNSRHMPVLAENVVATHVHCVQKRSSHVWAGSTRREYARNVEVLNRVIEEWLTQDLDE